MKMANFPDINGNFFLSIESLVAFFATPMMENSFVERENCHNMTRL
jgi:hypothetical protein